MSGRVRRSPSPPRRPPGRSSTPNPSPPARLPTKRWPRTAPRAFSAAPRGPPRRAADETLAAVDRLDDSQIPDILGLTSRSSLEVMALGSRARVQWHLGDVTRARSELLALSGRQPAPYAPW